MKAAVHTRYGPPDAIDIKEVDPPVPRDNEVLMKVRAASVNPLDRYTMAGTPYVARIAGGVGNLRKPNDVRLGIDAGGEIQAIGKNVTRFRIGDHVFGACKGAFAEYACGAESALASKPDNVTFEQAASAPIAALTALQGLRDKGRIKAGHKVLINGAAGGVGTFAVQIAKLLGADVTAVCSSRSMDMVQSIGADRIIDYAQGNFTRMSDRFDLLFDCIGNRSFSECRRVLTAVGIHVVVGAPYGRWMGPIGRMLKALALSKLARRKVVPYIAKISNEDLALIGDLVATGKVRPVIARRYRLGEIRDAIRYLEQGHTSGKVVIMFD